MEPMDRNAIIHAGTVEEKSIATTQMERASVDVILVILETCAKQVKTQAVFQLDTYTTYKQIKILK